MGIMGTTSGINLDGNITSVVRAAITLALNNGAIWYAWVEYDGQTQLLEVRVAQAPERPAIAALVYGIDLVAQLDSTDVFTGFTAGTGGAANDHDIRSWSLAAN